MTNNAQQTLATIVKENHHTVPVFEKYSLDFCCKGKRMLKDACAEKGLSVEAILQELETVTQPANRTTMPFTEMSAEQLVGHILIHHHFYVRQSMPGILQHLQRLVSKHGDRYPYLGEVLQLFGEINEEMLAHMQKEELILFPRIKDLEKSYMSVQAFVKQVDTISAPIQVMEAEHEKAGDILFKIRDLTNNYTAPADACTTFRITLEELKEFEDDLHQHVHLENNILFPKANLMLA